MKRFLVGAAMFLASLGVLQAQGDSRSRNILLNPATPVAAASPRSAQTYGTTQESLQHLGLDRFAPLDSTMLFGYTDGNTTFRRYATAVQSGFIATPTLPSGALVTGVDFDVCDTDGASEILMQLLSTDALGQNLAVLNGVMTAGTPGCAAVFVPLASPYEIQNGTGQLLVDVVLNAAAVTQSFAGATVHYLLQVSPAPGTATFADVPTGHLFFQYIEALAQSGITGGCGGGNYCPDDPVTRGQMAVFLAKALGLQFP